MKFELTILGCGSATPTLRHGPTSQILEYNNQLFLIDCGEGSQLQLRRYRIRFLKINQIFISHNHGDHCLGLPGLISTMHLLGRTKKLDVYCQKGLREAVEMQLDISHSKLRFPINWVVLDTSGKNLIYENKEIQVFSFPLSHRVPCCGFLFEEKPKLKNIRPELIEKYNIPIVRIRQIKEGSDYKLEDGTVVPNSELTIEPDAPKSYAFASDTAYDPETSNYVSGVNVLYHESTFLKEDEDRAEFTNHSTAHQAGQVAKEAGASLLILGHYSARYRSEEQFLSEAKEVFDNVALSDEGATFSITFKKQIEKLNS